MKKTVLIFFILFALPGFYFAQQKKLDSLELLLSSAKEDTSKVELLSELSAYHLGDNSAKALLYGNEAKELAIKIHDKKGLASSLNNIGLAYDNMGKYEEAMKNYFESLKIKETIHNLSGLASTYNNIGLVYDIQGSLDQALEYYQKAYDIQKNLKDETGLGNATLNIGVVYFEKGEKGKAIEFFRKAYTIAQQINNKKELINALNDIGLFYSSNEQQDSALITFEKVIEIGRKNNDSINIASAFNNKAVIFFNRHEFKKAILELNKAVNAVKLMNAKPNLKNYYENLAEVYDTLKDYKNAYYYHKLFSNLKDSIQNTEKSKRIAELQFSYDSEKKDKELKIMEGEKEIQRKTEENKHKLIVAYLVSGVVIILLILFLLYGRFRLVQKQKATIEDKNKLVEGKNKEITDSIYYARRIQRALLASENFLKKQLPEHFVLYKPKDIVSGDFYWASLQGEKFYLSVGDCTGHGVPGAFMSLLNMSFLNEAVIEKKINSPEKILEEVRQQIIVSLNPAGIEEESKDGMDAVLCMFDFKGLWLRFVCANNPLWLIRNNELKEFAADKMPVGVHHGEQKPYTLQTLGLRKGDIIYLFTDGYADQFGGSKGKKFKYQQLKELLITSQHLPMEEQKNILDKTIESWKGALEQVDDILIIGIRI